MEVATNQGLSPEDIAYLKHLSRSGREGIFARARCSRCGGNLMIYEGELFCIMCTRSVRRYKGIVRAE